MSDAGPSVGERESLGLATIRGQNGHLVAYALLGVLGAVLAGAAVLIPDFREMAAVAGGLLFLPLLPVTVWAARKAVPSGGPVEVSAEGLFLGGRLVVPRGDMERALVAEDRGRTYVSIQRRRGFFVIVDVATTADGERLVEALGLGVAQARSEFLLDSPLTAGMSLAGFIAFLLGGCATWFAMVLLAGGGVGLGFLALWEAAFLLMALPQKATVGLDGVLLRWLWRTRLVRFPDVTSVEANSKGVAIGLRGGETIALRTDNMGYRARSRRGDFGSDEAYREALAGRIRDAWGASRAVGPEGTLEVGALLRGQRDAGAWVAALRSALTRDAEGFREAPVFPEQLWAAVEDGQAAPEVRAAAAGARAPALDEVGKQRLRVAAGVVASPRLRVAIEAAAEGDDERLVEAMSAVEEAREGDGGRQAQSTPRRS
jgi:hypothetical protein